MVSCDKSAHHAFQVHYAKQEVLLNIRGLAIILE